MSSARVFINYRRADSAGWARQLHGDLEERFGKERVFRDVAIEPGVDFVEHIERVMNAAEVCIVVIGPGWASAANSDGRRLDNPDDLVRREIERALERPDVEVIPVLVDGARMPSERELPDSLRALARRNACELTDVRWDYDIEVLCRRLRRVLGESTVAHERPLPPNPERSHAEGIPAADAQATNVLSAALATMVAAAVAGVLAAALTRPLSGEGEGQWGRLAGYAAERGVIWAIIGAVVLATAAVAFGRSRVPLGSVVVGAGAGLLGGAAGGAGYMALKQFGEVYDGGAESWLIVFVSLALPGLLLAGSLARLAGARAGECALAAVAGAAVGAAFTGKPTLLIPLHAVVLVSAMVAVLAASPHRAPARAPRPALRRHSPSVR